MSACSPPGTRQTRQPTPAPLPPRAPGGSRLPGSARADRRDRGEWRRLQPLLFPGGTGLASRRELRAGDYDVVHVHEPLGAARRLGRNDLPRRAGRRHLPRLLHQGLPEPHSRRCSALAAGSTSSLRGSPSPRPRPGPGAAGSAASTRSSPTASTSRPRRWARSRRATSCACSSSAAPRSARACRSCSPPSRRWSSMFPARLTVVGADPEEISRLVADPDRADAHRRARQGLGLDPLAPARSGRPALRALSRRRELRHGPDRGDGRRTPAWSRRRSPDTATSSPTASMASWSRPPTRRRSARSCSCSRTSPSGSRRWARRGAAAPSATPGPGSPSRSPRSTSARSSRRPPRSGRPRNSLGEPALSGSTAARGNPPSACLRWSRPWTTPPAAGGGSPGRPESPSRASSDSA